MNALTCRVTLLTSVVLTVGVLAFTLLLCGSAAAQTEPYGVAAPSALNFRVAPGQTSSPLRVILENTGGTELTVFGVSITGNFAVPTNNCAAGVKPGAHCDVYVTFSPAVPGTQTGTLTFNDNASNSPQTVSLTGVSASTAPTKTTITASPNPMYVGQSITFTATVTSRGVAVPDGEQVLFQRGRRGTVFGYGTLQAGVASLTTSAVTWQGPSVGVRQPQKQQIVARYMGDQNFSSSERQINITVQRYSISGYLTSNPNPSIYCQPIIFTPYVTATGPYPAAGVVVLEGNFFFPGAGQVGEARTYKTCNGSGEEGGAYYGDPYDDWGFLSRVSQVVNPSPTTTSVTSSKHSSAQGTSVTFRVVVNAPFANVVDGSVTFTFGATTLGTVELSDSRGSVETSVLPVGQDTITATYTPSYGNFIGSSGSLVQTIR